MQKKFVKDSAWLLLSQVVLATCGILLNIIITKHFGISIFGSFSIALKIYLVVSIFSTFGVGVPALKYSAQYTGNREALNKSMSASIIIVLASSLIITVLVFILAPFFSSMFEDTSIAGILVVFVLALPFYSINKVLVLILNGQRDIKAVSVIQMSRWLLLISIISFIVFILDGKIELALLAFPITEFILLTGSWFYRSKYFSFSFNIEKRWLREHFYFGGKSMFSYAITDIYSYLDVFMLGFFVETRIVGLYSFASDIAKNLLVVADIFLTSFNPIFTLLFYKKQLIELNSQIKKIRNITYIIYIPLSLIAVVIYYLLINWMDAGLEESFVPFIILIAGVFLFSGFKPFTAILEFAGFPGAKLTMSSIILLLNFLLIIAFITWGTIGVALATSITYVFSIIVLHFFSEKKLNIKLIG